LNGVLGTTVLVNEVVRYIWGIENSYT